MIMKKLIIMVAMAFIAAATASAQSAIELAQKQKSLNDANRALVNSKVTKDAKKQGKALEKEGWKSPAGRPSVMQQVDKSMLMRVELMADKEGNPTPRYIVVEGMATGGTFNAAQGAARANALQTIASDIETKIAAAIESSIDNSQESQITAETQEKFHLRSKMIVDNSLTNVQTPLLLYRNTNNNLFQIQIQLAFDIKILKEKIKAQLKKELQIEGDALLNDLTNGIGAE